MAIARIQGNLLADNLERGANLAVEGNLLYIDVVNDRVGVLTSTPGSELQVVGNIEAGNIVNVNIISGAVLEATSAFVGNVGAGNISATGNIVVDGVTSNLFIESLGNITGENLVSNRNIYANGFVASISYQGTGNITIPEAFFVRVYASDFVQGNIVTNLVDSSDSSEIVVVPDVRMQASLTVEGDLDIGSVITGNLVTDLIDWNTSANVANLGFRDGRMYWDPICAAPAFQAISPQVEVTLGQDAVIRVFNNTGAPIYRGQVLRFTTGGANGAEVSLAQANSFANVYETLGLASCDIDAGGVGFVQTDGVIRNLDTSAFSAGDIVHVSPTVPGGLVDFSPTFPYFAYEVGSVLNSDAANGCILINRNRELWENGRVIGDLRVGQDLLVSGNLTVLGTETTVTVNNLNVANAFIYLGSGDTIGANGTVFTGTGLNDGIFVGHFDGVSNVTFAVRIDGVGTGSGGVDQFAWSTDGFATNVAANVDITGSPQLLANNISIEFNATTGHTLGDTWTGNAEPVNVQTGVIGNYANGVYAHTGLFRDVNDGTWKLFTGYTPEPNGNININDASFQFANLEANNYYGTFAGNVTTTGTVTANVITGNIDAADLTSGTVPSARLTGSYAIDISGTAATAITAGTVTTAAQPNITSVGNLTSVTVTGNTNTGNLITTGNGNVYTNFVFGNAIGGANTVALYTETGGQGAYATWNVDSFADPTLIVGGLNDPGSTSGNIIAGNISLGGNLSGVFVGNAFGNLQGNLIGNSYGNLQGNVIGSVFGDDLTLLIDSLENNIYANVVTANVFAGLLVGNVAANSILPGANVTYDIGATGNRWNNIYGNRFVGQSLVPYADEAGNIGESNLRWKEIFVSGTSIHLGNLVMSEVGPTVIGFFQSDGVTPAVIDSGSISAGSSITNGNSSVSVSANANVSVTVRSVPTVVFAENRLVANGNVECNYILGNGALLTGVITSVANINNGTSNVAIKTADGNITMGVNGTDNIVIISDTSVFMDTAFVTGNLTVGGNLNTVNVANIEIADPIIGIGRGSNNTPLTVDDGKDRGMALWYYDTAEKRAFIGWDDSTSQLIAATNVSISSDVITVNELGNIRVGNLDADFLTGNGYQLTGLTLDSFATIDLQGYTNAAAGGNVVISASGLSNLAVQAGNGITMLGNATTDTIVISVSGSTDDGTFFGSNSDAGSVADPTTETVDSGSVTTTPATEFYDLGALIVTDVPWTGIASNVIPETDLAYNLGSPDKRWNELYLSGNTIYLGGVSISAAAGTITLPATVNIGNTTLDASSGELSLPENISATTITAAGNITGDYILGNGALLTGVITSANSISSGSSNVVITESGTVSVNVSGGEVLNIGVADTVLRGNLVPQANITYSLGNTTNRFNDLYLHDSSIFIGAATITASGSTVQLSNAAVTGTTLSVSSGRLVYTSGTSSFDLYAGSSGTTYASVNGKLINQSPIGYNSNAIATATTITSAMNALSSGPIKINSGVTMTISSGAEWTIV